MNIPLCEKFRPKVFEDILGVNTTLLKTIISDVQTMPNILLVGPQGTGKTTCAKIILEQLKPINILRINGSDTTGIDTIRELVYNFITGASSIPNKPKIVWIEEFDFMSANAYAALRSMMEQYVKNSRFICTANYLQKIPEPIQSRFAIVEFKKPKDVVIGKRLLDICILENIEYDIEVIKYISEVSKGDFRTAINLLQQSTSNEGKLYKLEQTNNLSEEIYGLLNEGKWSEIRYNIPNRNPDYNKLLVELDNLFFNSNLSLTTKAEVNDIIAHGMFEMNFSFDKDISFAAICSRIIREIKK